MNEEIKKQLIDEIQIEMGNLNHMIPGSDEHVKATQSLTELLKQYREIEETEKNGRKEWVDKIVHWCLDLGKIAVPIAAYMVVWAVGIKYEETGSLTSPMFREFRQILKPQIK